MIYGGISMQNFATFLVFLSQGQVVLSCELAEILHSLLCLQVFISNI